MTWLVHEALAEKLREMDWKDGMSMLDFYYLYYVPFGELLTDMERYGCCGKLLKMYCCKGRNDLRYI